MPQLKTGQKLQVQISDVSRGGAGIAKHQGMTIMVPYTTWGDEAMIRITDVKRRFAQGELIDVVSPGTDRITPPCPVFGRCGGCQWQHIPYEQQWQLKQQGVLSALERGGIKHQLTLQGYPAGHIWHYRNRIQLRGKNNSVGFYAKGSHNIVAIDHCDISKPALNQEIPSIKTHPRARGSYKVELEQLANGDVKLHWNSPHAAGGFRQINDEQNQKLQQWVQQRVSNSTVFDLYGGSANLSGALAEAGCEVHCVDINITPPEQKTDSLHMHQEDVLPWLIARVTDVVYGKLPAPRSACAIIDPPRGGMGERLPGIMQRLEKLRVEQLILVGCKTDTWVRDIEQLLTNGWILSDIAAFDFFPHTSHVEAAACLSKTTV